MSPRREHEVENEETSPRAPARRAFMLGSAAAVPALLMGCAEPGDEEPAELEQPLRDEREERGRACALDDAQERLRAWWRQLVDRHMGEENAHDLPGVMATFSPQGEMIFNGAPFLTPEAIAAGHVLFGMSQQAGALLDTQVAPERTYYLDDGVLVEGRVIATHVGEVQGFPGSGKRVSLPYSAIYQFDRRGRLVSERIVMNWFDLAVPPG
ncbi:MAG TPA: nuclear transport factor 2 family protein [Polyangiales bacterium]